MDERRIRNMVSRSQTTPPQPHLQSWFQGWIRLRAIPSIWGQESPVQRFYVRKLGVETSRMSYFSVCNYFLVLKPVWRQDEISEDEETHGSMFVPIILGSDKTTVSVATGNNEYWPIYMSIGNIHNNTWRSHRNGVVLLGFHAIPKCAASIWGCRFNSNSLIFSREAGCRLRKIPKIPPTIIPCNAHEDTSTAEASDVETRGCTMCRWSLPPGDIWDWSIYCGLSWTMPALRYCSRMVSEVRLIWFVQYTLSNLYCWIQVYYASLQSRFKYLRTSTSTTYCYFARGAATRRTMGRVRPRWWYCRMYFISMIKSSQRIVLLAIHGGLSTRRYLWTHFPRSSASVNQGDIQRSHGNLDSRIPCQQTWRSSS